MGPLRHSYGKFASYAHFYGSMAALLWGNCMVLRILMGHRRISCKISPYGYRFLLLCLTPLYLFAFLLHAHARLCEEADKKQGLGASKG